MRSRIEVLPYLIEQIFTFGRTDTFLVHITSDPNSSITRLDRHEASIDVGLALFWCSPLLCDKLV